MVMQAPIPHVPPNTGVRRPNISAVQPDKDQPWPSRGGGNQQPGMSGGITWEQYNQSMQPRQDFWGRGGRINQQRYGQPQPYGGGYGGRWGRGYGGGNFGGYRGRPRWGGGGGYGGGRGESGGYFPNRGGGYGGGGYGDYRNGGYGGYDPNRGGYQGDQRDIRSRYAGGRSPYQNQWEQRNRYQSNFAYNRPQRPPRGRWGAGVEQAQRAWDQLAPEVRNKYEAGGTSRPGRTWSGYQQWQNPDPYNSGGGIQSPRPEQYLSAISQTSRGGPGGAPGQDTRQSQYRGRQHPKALYQSYYGAY